MKILVAYYSRGGTTRRVAECISGILDSDIEEIEDTRNRRGILGFLKIIPSSLLRKTTVLKRMEKNPPDYDIVVIGTPVWTSNVSIPVRTYIRQYREQFRNICFFCTECGSGHQKVFREMEELAGKTPKAMIAIAKRKFIMNPFKLTEKMIEFCREVKKFSEG